MAILERKLVTKKNILNSLINASWPPNLISWRRDNSLVAWLTQSPGLNPAAADIFPWCTHMQ